MASLHLRLVSRMVGMLPNRSKRLVLIVSLSAFIMRCTTHDDARMVELNNQLHLCPNIKAMQLPIYASALIWNSKAVSALAQELNQKPIGDRARCVAELHAMVPDWLRYDCAAMESDLSQLTRHLPA